MRESDRERRLVPALISFCSEKKDMSAPNPVERRVLRQSIRPPSSIYYSVGRSALRQALRLPSGVPPSIGLSIFHQAFRPPSGSLYSVGNFALRRVLNLAICRPLSVLPPLRVLPSVGISAFRRASRPPSDSPFYIGLSVSVGRSAVRRVLHSAISRPLSVSPSFEQFDDFVINTPTGYSFSDMSTVSSKRRQGFDSSDMRTMSYISQQDLALSNLRTMSSKSGLIYCTLSMSHDTDIAVNCNNITTTGNKDIFLKTSAYTVP